VNLLLVDIDAAGLESIGRGARLGGNEIRLRPADAADPAAAEALLREVQDSWGALHVLVNSAGNLYWGPTEAMTPEQSRKVIDVNLSATVYLTREFLPLLIAQDEAHIVNVASTAGLLPAYHRALYSVCKAACIGLSESLRIEHAGSGLGVTAVCPGFVSGTGLFRSIMTARGGSARAPDGWDSRFTSAEAVAEATIDSIYRRGGIVYGSPGDRLLGWAERIAPAALERFYGRMARRGRRGYGDPDFVSQAQP
jgi:NAD(P)-dependent dehydrogenase (short-subunit alcohol dehydrogenase family)